ncbi:MAG: glutamate-5-semialdehyde dehydrogenase [Clostridiales bacterium]|nr:glutamate-5-semialdehyde dehydrogenase [Clostridiales bacterium]
MVDLIRIGSLAKTASTSLLNLSEERVNKVLLDVANLIRENAEFLKERNKIDMSVAEKSGRSASFLDRLLLSDKVIESIAEGIEQVAELFSPLDKTTYQYNNDFQGISITQKTVPFGVIGIIYEARPNVTADAFALCFKTKNAVVLKGGSDAINSNIAMVSVIRQGLIKNGVDENAVTVIEDTSRETTLEFMKLKKYVDLLIPRGSASLIKSAVENSTIPIIETGSGNCHVYVDKFADVDKAAEVIFNAKTQRYSVCNACESLVIHADILEKALPKIALKLSEKQVELRLDERAYKVLKSGVPATEQDFYTEYGDAIISVKTVDSIDEAIAHINEHSTHHSEAIITEDKNRAEKFLNEIDSSSVYHNASTRFTDGFVFGFGAEIGISTQKLHARGPMGLNALVTTKFLVTGNGAVRK